MKTRVHVIAGTIATFTIAAFFTSTIFVELFGSRESITTVKRLIAIPGLFILIPAIATAGATGFRLSRSRKEQLAQNKKKRMRLIAVNGIFILAPSAIILHLWSVDGIFSGRFYILQSIELIAGATNLIMMGRNMRDGLRMSGGRSKRLIR